jgi:hypothetical protein
MSKKKKIIIICIIAFVLISVFSTISFAIIHSKRKLETKEVNTEIVINDLKNSLNNYSFKLTDVEGANKYSIEVYDEENNQLLTNDYDSTDIKFTIDKEYLRYNKKFLLNIIAYKDSEEISKLSNMYEIVWNEPSISSETLTDINNASSFIVKVDGSLDDDTKIVIKDGDNELYNEVLTSNDFEVPSKFYRNKNITLNIDLLSEDEVVSSIVSTNTYVSPTTTKVVEDNNPISDIVITSPSNYISLNNIVDVTVEYTGGDGATSKNIYIYQNNDLIKSEVLTSNTYIIPASTFSSNNGYRVVVEAVNGNYKKSDSTYISTIVDGRSKIIELARSQVGNVGGEKFWSWWGYSYRVEWCAIFVSWCADQLGYLDAGVIPKFQGVGTGVRWFKDNNQFQDGHSTYIPQEGDIIFFDYNKNSTIDHVGFVIYSDGEYVYTVEGNTGAKPGTSAEKKYKLSDTNIYGYGTPNY